MTDRADAIAAAAPAGAGRAPRPAPARRLAGLAPGVAVAASALTAGTAVVGAGVVWVPPRGDAHILLRGAEVYAAECAGCHGARLEGQVAARARPGDALASRSAPPLGASGHAWRHSDAELAAIVADGAAGDDAGPGGGMPGFAARLGPDEIEAVLAHVKSRWPAGIPTYQAALDRGGGDTFAALPRDPAWTFPGGCLSATAGDAGR